MREAAAGLAFQEGRGFIDFWGGRIIGRGHDIGDVAGEVVSELLDELNAFGGDLDHDFAAVIGGVEALDVAQFFQAVDEAGRGGRAVTHFAGDVGHGQLLLTGEVSEQKELGVRDVPAVQFTREVEQE